MIVIRTFFLYLGLWTLTSSIFDRKFGFYVNIHRYSRLEGSRIHYGGQNLGTDEIQKQPQTVEKQGKTKDIRKNYGNFPEMSRTVPGKCPGKFPIHVLHVLASGLCSGMHLSDEV